MATIEAEQRTKFSKTHTTPSSVQTWSNESILFVSAAVAALSAYLAAALGAMTQDTDRSPSAFACYWTAGIFAFGSVLLVMVALVVATRSAHTERIKALKATSLKPE